jgi:transcriptional regulator with XRE-family HTH domain
MHVFESLGKALRWLRARQDRRQYETARLAGITKAMLSAYETGKQKPSLETLDKLLEALGADLDDLHEALSIVNERGGAGWSRRAAGRPAVASGLDAEADVYRVLGIDHRLDPEHERAFREMLDGFHRLLRYLHANLTQATRGAAPDTD